MEKITVSLNPSYLCNFRCSFCYLSHEQLGSKRLLPLNVIQGLLEEVSQYREIETIDLYGGEPLLLPRDYFFNLISVILPYVDNINVITNLSTIRDVLKHPIVNLSVSYDFHARESHEKVFENMLKLSDEGIAFNVLTLASREVIQMDTDEMAKAFSKISTLQYVEIKHYSNKQNNQFNVLDSEFESFVLKFIQSANKYGIKCNNEDLVFDSLNGTRNSFSDDHIYITPNGFAVLEFDLNNNEYFKHLDNFQEYLDWTETEKQRVNQNSYCQQCEYLGRCLSEHLREVKNLDNSCNGYYYLLKHFDKET